jgi:pyrroloquinoline quinone biosynthesis protein B
LPQWNCACANCAAARTGRIAPQTQSSIAISGDDEEWFLVNASPDLARQIESTPALQPRRDSPRNSPIAGVFLANADLDHALGLLLLRQQETPIVVYGRNDVRSALQWAETVLAQFCGIDWRTAEEGSLGKGLSYRAIDLPASRAFQLHDRASGAVALIAPAAGQPNDGLRAALNDSDTVLFDGTFWSDSELRSVRPSARSAREMHHLPINGGSLELLGKCSARRKIYTHINNTNPILMPGSRERQMVEQAGIEIGYDGLELQL